MVIEWIAHACFRVTLEDGRCLVFDPFCNIGYQMPKIRADLVTVSHGHFDHNAVDALTGDFRVFDKAGAYAIQGHAALWCAGIEGCYYNIMGLPVHRAAQLLREFA